MAEDGSGRVDRITLRDHVVEAEIGAFQGERGRRQRLRFAVAVDVRSVRAGDDVDRIVSYDLLTEAVESELAAERLNLLETLAERIAARVLAPEAALAARVSVEKLDLAPGALGVEIARRRDEVHAEAESPVRPRVCYLGNPAVGAADLPAWLDGQEGPAILCVGPPEEPVPESGNAAAQRRVDFLAIEQNAWLLAGRDARCIVRETRTEMEWAARRGEHSVWAPSKLALEVAGAPGPDGPALAAWLARLLAAEPLIFVDAELPDGVTAERESIA